MLHHTMLVALLAFAGTLSAQIFPKIEREAVQKRIAEGKPSVERPDPEEEDEPDDPPAGADELDGDKVLARYRAILKEYADDERGVKKATTKHTDDLHDGIRKYIEGTCLLRLGYYKDAERLFKDVRYKVEDKEHIKKRSVENIADDIESGAAFYFRAMAAAMQHWEDFEDRPALDEAWLEAEEDALDVKDDLESLIRRGLVENGAKWVQAIGVWVHEAKDHWIEMHRAEKNLEKFPGNVNTWIRIAKLASAENYKAEDEYTPMYLKQRAAIQVIKEFWGGTEYVTSGAADIALGSNHITTGQLDDWELFYVRKAYHTEDAKNRLRASRNIMSAFVNALEDMKND